MCVCVCVSACLCADTLAPIVTKVCVNTSHTTAHGERTDPFLFGYNNARFDGMCE